MAAFHALKWMFQQWLTKESVAGNSLMPAYVLFSVLMNFYLTVKEEQELMEEMNEDEPIKAKKRK